MARKTLVSIAVALVAAVGTTTVAQAHQGPGRGFLKTYPVASRLCAKAAAGKLPASLQGSAAQITAACTTLQSSLKTAKDTYNAAVAPLQQQAKDAINALRTACQQAKAANDWNACKAAWDTARAKLTDIAKQAKAAQKAYHQAVEAARKAFWATVKPLYPAATPDKTTTTTPAATLPKLPAQSLLGLAFGRHFEATGHRHGHH
ncbi:MAG TPA: hypothetical protein VHB30_00865 [Solirubrobacteraceae bacterium]|jgi:hypothetical protein|nr:hypothetical protein [Solirubrobacteraceae bacterium]